MAMILAAIINYLWVKWKFWVFLRRIDRAIKITPMRHEKMPR